MLHYTILYYTKLYCTTLYYTTLKTGTPSLVAFLFDDASL